MNPPNLPKGKPYSFLMNKERPVSRQNPLNVNKESHKITKNAPLQKPLKSIKQIEEPRVIYTIPQRVIHITPPSFKDVVQSLTGIEKPNRISEVSPAARLASTEGTSLEKKERSPWSNGSDDMMRMLDNGEQMSQFSEILLPEPAVLQPLPYENFLPKALPPQIQHNNFLAPLLPQVQYNNFWPATLPSIQHNNFSSTANVMPLTTSEIFSPVNLPPIHDAFLPDTWQQKPSDSFSPVTLPQSDIFSPDSGLPSDIFSPVTLPQKQSDNLLPDNWQPSDILSSGTWQQSDDLSPDSGLPSDIFSSVTLPQKQSDNLLPDNWHPSDILSSGTWQQSDDLSPDNWKPSDILSPDTLQPSDNPLPDNWQPSDILLQQSPDNLSTDKWQSWNIVSPDFWQPSDILSPVTLPSTQSDTFSTDPWEPIQSDIFTPPVALPPTPSDTWQSSDTFSPETLQPLQPKLFEAFLPVLDPQSQTVLSYNDVWPENNAFAKPSEFLSASVVPPQTPSSQFSSFNYD